MSGETEANVSGWTTDTLRVHVFTVLGEHDRRWEERFREKDVRDQQRFDAQQKALTDALLAQEKAVAAALSAANTAVGKAEVASEKRLDSVNEFRGQLKDQQATLISRAEADARFASITDSITELKDRANRSDGKGAGVTTAWVVLVAVIGMGVGVAGVLLAVFK